MCLIAVLGMKYKLLVALSVLALHVWETKNLKFWKLLEKNETGNNILIPRLIEYPGSLFWENSWELTQR